MRKTFYILLFVAFASSFFVACNKSTEQPVGGQSANPVSEVSEASGSMKIAFVRMDSVLNNYQGYKDMSKKLEAKANANQTTLAGKERNLQREMAAFQEKVQSGGFVNELAAQQEYEKIQKKGLQAQQQASAITESFLKEQQHFNDSLNNIILKEVEKYNEEKGYDLILTTVQMSSVLYGKPQYDITKDIIDRLNENYKAQK